MSNKNAASKKKGKKELCTVKSLWHLFLPAGTFRCSSVLENSIHLHQIDLMRSNHLRFSNPIGNLIYTFPYGGFLKCWYPQIILFHRVFHYKPSILGYHYFRKPPYQQNIKLVHTEIHRWMLGSNPPRVATSDGTAGMYHEIDGPVPWKMHHPNCKTPRQCNLWFHR